MNSALRDIWVENLRSGNFEQGGNALRSEAGGQVCFCPLGVLCETAGQLGYPVTRPVNRSLRNAGSTQYNFKRYNTSTRRYDSACSNQDIPFPEVFGLTQAQQRKIIELNRQCDFEEIADYIEDNF